MEVIAATSYDENFNVRNVLNKNPKDFWITTGMFPQELLIDLKVPKAISRVTLQTTAVRKIKIEGCEKNSPTDFTVLKEAQEFGGKGGMQKETISVNEMGSQFHFVKIIILEGYEDFATVHNIEVM
eukprot:TRINITY_DN35509_c0_g1_i1.p4 TRINITY_DN35509_c0_g1~~TRINITY_DN35509_c0_g1_i1.p4  ORF type:complete len:126 (+),score=22.61 TRINITY_DN35509_c0_g1_i1:3-380(+)